MVVHSWILSSPIISYSVNIADVVYNLRVDFVAPTNNVNPFSFLKQR
jgi:hypothetical protein